MRNEVRKFSLETADIKKIINEKIGSNVLTVGRSHLSQPRRKVYPMVTAWESSKGRSIIDSADLKFERPPNCPFFLDLGAASHLVVPQSVTSTEQWLNTLKARGGGGREVKSSFNSF